LSAPRQWVASTESMPSATASISYSELDAGMVFWDQVPTRLMVGLLRVSPLDRICAVGQSRLSFLLSSEEVIE
jgi:hypothetical protein